MAAAKEEAPPPARGGIGGLVGGLGRRMAGRDNADTGRATVLSMTMELQDVSTDVSAEDVALAAEFEQK
jgi:hypothetical protein